LRSEGRVAKLIVKVARFTLRVAKIKVKVARFVLRVAKLSKKVARLIRMLVFQRCLRGI
jgi:hypothetical protein